MSAREAGDDASEAGFDQTNGLAQGLEGESDGTAEGEEASPADRDVPPLTGQQDVFAEDHYGAEDGRDPNP